MLPVLSTGPELPTLPHAELGRPTVRAVPKEWDAQLAELSPPTNRFQYLKLIHEAGYPWELVDRYMIYEMRPARLMTSGIMPMILEQLEHGLPPSEMGNYFDQYANDGEGKFIRNPDCLITERAWHLFRETGAWGRPYWVIQGEHGGHKRWFSNVEKKLMRVRGLPTEPPEPGELPFAEFDQRVLARVAAHDVLRGKYGGVKRSKSLLHGAFSSRVAEDEKQVREELIAWLTEQVKEFAPDVHKALMRLDAPRTRGGKDQIEMERASEQAVQNFIETGKSHGGAPLKLIT